jgi:hypothetical protein
VWRNGQQIGVDFVRHKAPYARARKLQAQ